MRLFLLFCGRILGLIYPYRLHSKISSLMEWLYTGYRSRGFRYWGHNSKMGFKMHIYGQDKIVVLNNVFIGGGTALTAFCNDGDVGRVRIKIGDDCMIGNDCHITALCGIAIGNGLRTGKSILISDNSHGNPSDMEHLSMQPNSRPLYSKGPIVIGKNVWIGEKAVILGNVSIGDGAIIGANTVVTHDIPPYSVAVGCPAKVIKTLC